VRRTRLLVVFVLLVSIPVAASSGSGFPEGYWFELTAKVVNAVVFFGVLFWLLKKPIAGAMKSQREDLARRLQEAEEKEKLADRKLKEIEERMARLSDEVEEILKRTDEAANREKDQIIQRAKEEAEKIRRTAEREIENRMRTARLELHQYLMDLAVSKAEQLMRERMTESDVRQSMDRYIRELEEA